MENEKKNMPLFKEIWEYLKVMRAWWLVPIIILLVLVGLLVIFAHTTSTVGPFIYALF